MKALEELEQTVKNLPPDQLAKFRDWFNAFDHANWDRQIEADSKAGRLDHLAAEAIADYRAGKARDI
ncbi:MAG TPA: hypothetical protein VIS77_15895 [Burkholderiales bacterium]